MKSEKLQTHLTHEVYRALSKHPLPSDGAKVTVCKQLSLTTLTRLLERKTLAIHIPGYFAQDLAALAQNRILRQAKVENWKLGRGKHQTSTDMNYAIGFPRLEAHKNARAAHRYLRESLPAIRKIRQAFAPYLSPMDQLRLELSELWSSGVEHVPFNGHPGLLGLTRIMQTNTLLAGDARLDGVCHVDALPNPVTLSSNLYVSMPKTGGELKIWNVEVSEKSSHHPIFKLLRTQAFDPTWREVIPHLLPPPLVLRPKVGDLIILDSSRPHAVAGFRAGRRISIQTFITLEAKSGRLKLWS